MTMVTVQARRGGAPPAWAHAQRALIDAMNQAAPLFQQRYTHADGTFVWRERWPGFDGSDDGYESYHNWALFHALGGDGDLYRRSWSAWQAVTRQFSGYGQIWREFDAGYDWMHHGESSLLLYSFGLVDPANALDRARSLRFARMYTGDDPEATNWDAARRMLRSPINGSRGPRFVNAWDDWSTHRAVLAAYPAPFDDIPGVVGPVADWNDDAVYREILALLNARQMRGDVPLNLTATSLVTHAYAYTGDDAYRRWVLDYVEAWAGRIAANGGICPDNVGPNGVIGELMGGRWWGGYYGWRWPHGLMTILQPLAIAAMNAVLLTGDLGYLDIPRRQLDAAIERGRVVDGVWHVPQRHTDAGWVDFRPLSPEIPLQLWALSHDPRDVARLDAVPERRTGWQAVRPGRGKGDDIHIAPWYCWLRGENPAYPEQILAAQWDEVLRRMQLIRDDVADPETIDVHHWQDRNPVHTEALVQLTLGGPQLIYHGGLLHTRLRHFDALARRPGLPPDVAALVHHIDAAGVSLTFVNTSVHAERRVLTQAGAFGEHQIEHVALHDDPPQPVAGRGVMTVLPPGAQATLHLTLRRFAHHPTYRQPFDG